MQNESDPGNRLVRFKNPWSHTLSYTGHRKKTSVLASTAKQPKPIVRSIAKQQWAVKRFRKDQSQTETDVGKRRDASMTSPSDVVP